ncbi:MAG: Ig-like domain-containing protein, partial [Burkholderiaceae bacterium]
STVKSGNDWTLLQSGSKFTEFPNLYEGTNQAADTTDAVTNENSADATLDKAGHPWGGRGTVKYHGWGNGLTAVEVMPDSANLTVGSTETSFYFKGDQKDVFKPQQLVWLRMVALEIPIAGSTGSGVAPAVGSFTATPSGSSVTVAGGASDADNDLSNVEVEFDGNGTWLQASGTTNWTLTKSGMSAGSHVVRARATDSAAHVSAVSGPVNFTTSSFACTATTANNNAHVTAGRATTSGGYAYAKGSGTNMGLNNTFTTTTLAQTSSGYYIIGNCP